MTKLTYPTEIKETDVSIYGKGSYKNRTQNTINKLINVEASIRTMNWHILQANYSTEEEYQKALAEFNKMKSCFEYVYEWVNAHYHFSINELGAVELIENRLSELT